MTRPPPSESCRGLAGGRLLPIALAALLLLAAPPAPAARPNASLPEAEEPMELAFRVVASSAPASGVAVPDGFEPAAEGSPLWRRAGPPPDDAELARIARSSSRSGCDLLLEKRLVDGETFYAPHHVFRKALLTGLDVRDATLFSCSGENPDCRELLVFAFKDPDRADQVAASLNRSWPWPPRRLAVVTGDRILGIDRRSALPAFHFPCDATRDEAEAVAKDWHAVPLVHRFTVSPLDTSGLSATEARDRAVRAIPARYLVVVQNPHAVPARATPDGETGLAISLPPMIPNRHRVVLSALLIPDALAFRPVASENDAWLRGLVAATAPDGFETVVAPDGEPAWFPVKPLDEEDDGSDGNPVLPPSAIPEGCLVAWENLPTDYPAPVAFPLHPYPVRRPYCLSASSVLDIAAVQSATPLPSAGDAPSAIRIELLPDDRAALEDMARALAPGQRVAFLYADLLQATFTAADILSGAPLLVRYTPIGGFDEPAPNYVDSFVSCLARLLAAAPFPAFTHYDSSTPP